MTQDKSRVQSRSFKFVCGDKSDECGGNMSGERKRIVARPVKDLKAKGFYGEASIEIENHAEI
jgi:hypothetical protein